MTLRRDDGFPVSANWKQDFSGEQKERTGTEDIAARIREGNAGGELRSLVISHLRRKCY